MARRSVLVTCPLVIDHIDEYDETFAAHGVTYDVADVDQHLDEAQLLDRIDGYHGVLAGDDEFTTRVFAAADPLEVISKWGIGTDNIDVDAADQHGVTVSNTPGAFADEVADIVVGYLLLLTRRLHEIDRRVRAGEWYSPRGVSLSGRTLGVVGVGNIGSEVVRRGAALGMDLLAHDVDPLPTALQKATGVTPVECDRLFEAADVVSLNCPLTDATRGLVGRAELDALGPDGYLVNTARGELVDEAALVDALRTDRIAGAALDVYRTEPLPADHPLTALDDVVLGSHNAQNTHEAVRAVTDRAVDNLLAGLTTA